MGQSNLSVTLCILSLSILFNSCAINRTIPAKQLDTSIVPADFNPQKHILLVVEMPRKNKPDDRHVKLTNQMNDLLEKYYPYSFEIVSMASLRADNPKYADTAIYKYAVLNSLNGVQHTTRTTITHADGRSHSVSPTATTTYISYYFLDRFTNKKYSTSYPSAWLKTSVQAFANTVKKAKNI